MNRWRIRNVQKMMFKFFWCSAALAMIARTTGCDAVSPVIRSTTTLWYHVINSQGAGADYSTTVCTYLTISRIESLTVKVVGLCVVELVAKDWSTHTDDR